jgi:enolase
LQDKGKYEPITGQQKLAEDMADFWSEILHRYPVIGIIDPIRKQVSLHAYSGFLRKKLVQYHSILPP